MQNPAEKRLTEPRIVIGADEVNRSAEASAGHLR